MGCTHFIFEKGFFWYTLVLTCQKSRQREGKVFSAEFVFCALVCRWTWQSKSFQRLISGMVDKRLMRNNLEFGTSRRQIYGSAWFCVFAVWIEIPFKKWVDDQHVDLWKENETMFMKVKPFCCTCVWMFAFKLANLDLTQSRFFWDRVMLMLDLARNLFFYFFIFFKFFLIFFFARNLLARPIFSERVPRCTSGGFRWRALSTCIRICLEIRFNWVKNDY